MITPGEALQRLDDHAKELEQLSEKLGLVSSALEAAERDYQNFIDSFEVGMYLQYDAENKRLPSEAMRLKLARREMRPELLGQRDELTRRRERIKQRISDIKVIIESERSILSALKESIIH